MDQFVRKNGLTWPLDFRQIIGIIFVVYFALMFYGTFCISLNQPWSYVLAIVNFINLLINNIQFLVLIQI
jgi:hypothetical protein